jgi:arylamine N-acetyltransferase
MLTNEEVKAYLSRLGIKDIEPPTKEYFFELHKAHVESVPWQTIDIFAGKPVGIDLKDSVQLILNHRSGYCFHHNGAFSALLRTLGYKVHYHRAGVQPPGTEPQISSFHLGLTVNVLNDHLEEEIWIADVGLGDMPFEPLPLQVGIYHQAPFTYKVVESGVAAKGWRLEHDPLASFVGVDFDPTMLDSIEEFKPKHQHYSRSSDSPWLNMFLIRHRHAAGSNELRGCVWSKRDIHGIQKIEINNKSQWLEVLGDIFGEKLLNYSSQERDELWKRVRIAHEDWKKSQAI